MTVSRVILVAAAAALVAGCQQPVRCGADSEPCCVIEGSTFCTQTGLSCTGGYCLPGAATACPGSVGPCDIGLQNCGGGQSCRITTGANVECGPTGGGTDQVPCTTNADCATGHYCSPLSGRCHRQCCGAESQCAANQACIVVSDTMPGPGLCVGSDCDPFGGTGCAPGAGCYTATNDAGAWIRLCVAQGTSPTGGPCTNFFDCAPGNLCTTAGTCVALCHPSAPSCATGTCQTVDTASDLGFCG